MKLSNRRMVELSNCRLVEWNGGPGLMLSNGVHHSDPDPRCFTGDFSLFEIECARQFIACAILAVIAWAAHVKSGREVYRERDEDYNISNL